MNKLIIISTIIVILILLLIIYLYYNKNEVENYFSLSPEYNPFISRTFPLNRKNDFRETPKKSYIKSRYYGIYKNHYPYLGPCGSYKIENTTLHYALNSALLDPKCGIVAYDNKNSIAYYYPYGNYTKQTAIKLKPKNNVDTYFKI
jgi:hypothetical protein